MDAANAPPPPSRVYLVGTRLTHRFYTATQRFDLFQVHRLFDSFGAGFTPELKSASVEMPFNGFTQEDYAQKLVDEYKAAGIDPSRVWLQSFNLDDIRYWIANEPEFGAQAVYLDDRYEAADEDEGLIDPMDAATFMPTMQELADMGVNYLAPPTWMLVTLNDAGEIVPSVYAEEAKAAGLMLITWTLERSGPLATGGGWLLSSRSPRPPDNDGVHFELLDVLARERGRFRRRCSPTGRASRPFFTQLHGPLSRIATRRRASSRGRLFVLRTALSSSGREPDQSPQGPQRSPHDRDGQDDRWRALPRGDSELVAARKRAPGGGGGVASPPAYNATPLRRRGRAPGASDAASGLGRRQRRDPPPFHVDYGSNIHLGPTAS